MRVLTVDTYYPGFLESVYDGSPGLAGRSYEEQLGALMDLHFGTADYYSRNLAALGHGGAEVVANCQPLQRRWAEERGLEFPTERWGRGRLGGVLPWPRRVRSTEWVWKTVAAQVREYRPDVLHVQDMNAVPPGLLRELRPFVRLLTGQIASAVAPGADFAEYDLVLSSFPHFVERFRAQGLRSEYFQLGFEPRVLERVRPAERRDLVFVGGVSARHARRTRFLETIASRFPLDWWGYGVDQLEAGSPLRESYRGPAWGLEMYQRLADARVTINIHIDTAAEFANNMRLYEATGIGTLLLTDAKRNLGEIFVPGREVVAYDSPEQALELIGHFLPREDERASIARAGQARTLSTHTYRHRMEEFAGLVQPLLRSRGNAA